MARLTLGCFLWLTVLGLADRVPAQTPWARGQKLVRQYFQQQVQQIEAQGLADIHSKADWEKKRPEYRRQLLEMLGLWPLPPKTDLHAVVTGKIDNETFTVEKLHFQSRPGLYVTGNLYIPKKAVFPAPAILYVCGHASTIINGVSYGHHVNYQHHPRWFAEHGYVCLIIDTLQLGEIQGIHHGTWPQHNMWWWHTLGYTPAGVECWNGIRALDYLCSRKEVDAKRIGVTGRSGGGATSWWIAAADDRPACIVPVAGIADLRAHLLTGLTPRFQDGVISGHCECMYMVNSYRWDFPLVAALCAPRPLMLGNSDTDAIFPVPGFRRLEQKVKKIYELYGAAEKFVVLETTGPHKDTPELRLGAYSWMQRWLQDGGRPVAEISEVEAPRFTPQELKVFAKAPADAINAVVQDTFIRAAAAKLPKTPAEIEDWWPKQRQLWLRDLQEKVFAGWTKTPPPLAVEPAADIRKGGLRLRAFDFQSESAVPLRLWLLTAAQTTKPKLVVLTALDDRAWQEWTAMLGTDFAEVLQTEPPKKSRTKERESNRRVLEKFGWAFATVAPRGVGPTAWAKAGSSEDQHIKRRFVLVGQTCDGQRVWDVRRALAVLRTLPELAGVPLWLQGQRSMAGIVLYAALFEPDVERLDLWDLPASHQQGPILLQVRKYLDLPQAVALAWPRSVVIYTRSAEEARRWEWPQQLQQALGKHYLKLRTVPQEATSP